MRLEDLVGTVSVVTWSVVMLAVLAIMFVTGLLVGVGRVLVASDGLSYEEV